MTEQLLPYNDSSRKESVSKRRIKSSIKLPKVLQKIKRKK